MCAFRKCSLVCQIFLSTKLTCSVAHLRITQQKVNKVEFAYMLNTTCAVP